MKITRIQNHAARRGLTLIELVVVMAILAALAGILLPKLPGMLTRAHTSTGATNAGELAKSIQTYHTLYLGYPNNLDSLVTTVAAGTPATYLVSAGSDVTTVTLQTSDGTLSALNSAGVTSVTQMVESTGGATSGTYKWSPTFYPYAAPTGTNTTPAATTLADGNKVLGITGAAASRLFGGSAAARYVVFGIGRYSTLSKVLQDAPVHFADEAEGAPTVAYARFGAVFQVTDDAGTGSIDKAQLVGIVSFHDGELASIGEHLAEYWAAK